MKKFIPDNTTKIILPEIDEYEEYFRISYRLNTKGCINFGDNSWIFMESNSSHINTSFGDNTLAMDNQKINFTNKGHVCGGIIYFQCLKKKEIKNTADFFTNFTSDIDSVRWKAVKIK
ncbi:MAG: hypothetical protein PHR81_10350 [Bacteroidales bacterium]|jgi:hypothetical protein|nr:hypothetical protein [Bacteroidales bacterium]MDD4215201.1 hypothetical protein [Bacteroidales bacterium]